MTMTKHTTTRRGRLRLALAAAVALTALTIGTTGAVAAPALVAPAAEATLLGATTSTAPQAPSPAPGFLLERGRFTPVAIPCGQEQLAPDGINPIGINVRGQIVGEYLDRRDAGRRFLLERGRFTTINVPGAKATNAQKINNRGQIVGVAGDPENLPGSQPTDAASMSMPAG
jgi:hypothetical protein